MEIEYCNNVRLDNKVEQDTKNSIRTIIDLIENNSGCSHEDIKVSICINDPLSQYTKGNIFCKDCNMAIIRFKGNILNPIYEYFELEQ
jgi:hypothetical protein